MKDDHNRIKEELSEDYRVYFKKTQELLDKEKAKLEEERNRLLKHRFRLKTIFWLLIIVGILNLLNTIIILYNAQH